MKELITYLSGLPKGRIKDATNLEKILIPHWSEFPGSGSEGMYPVKLFGRMENIYWEYPILSFTIERHGGTVMGSTRAELQHWIVDVQEKTAEVVVNGYRQIIERGSRFDVTPIADELADAIIHNRYHKQLKWSANSRVQVLSGSVFPDGFKQTKEGHKARLINALERRLGPQGWQRHGAWWVYKS